MTSASPRAMRIGGITIVLGLALTGCGTAVKPEAATQTSTVANSADSDNYTIVDYIRQNGIVETPVRRGDPGIPTLTLPMPRGWADAGPRTPKQAWGALVSAAPQTAQDPPTIVTLMSRLTGNVNPAKILEHAPNRIKHLPGYSGESDGNTTKFDGFDAHQIGGSYLKNGAPRVVSQKTVVIPGQDGLYMLQLNGDAPQTESQSLQDATAAIDTQSTITP